jgi:hypothetical protein
MAATDTGDFKDKQFEKAEVADKVVEQYDEECARIFYKHVMVSISRFPLMTEFVDQYNCDGRHSHLTHPYSSCLNYSTFRAEVALTFTMVAL